jgi:hypothetical protein
MACVAMTRSRPPTHPRVTDPEVHTLRRGNTYSAAHYFRQMLTHDDRPHTMQTEAERTPAQQLPHEIADLLARNDTRRRLRRGAWRQQVATARTFRTGYERATAAAQEASMDIGADGLEL